MTRTKRLSRHANAGIHKEPVAQKSGKAICLRAEAELCAAAIEQRYKFLGPVTDKPIFVSEPWDTAA